MAEFREIAAGRADLLARRDPSGRELDELLVRRVVQLRRQDPGATRRVLAPGRVSCSHVTVPWPTVVNGIGSAFCRAISRWVLR